MPIRQVITPFNAKPIKIWTTEIEETAEKQLRNLARLPFIHKHVASMADTHWGNGTSVGTVIATVRAIIPAAVGVDVGCGVIAYRLLLKASDLPDNLGPMRAAIERAVPHGRTDNGGRNDRGAWGDPSWTIIEAWSDLDGDKRYQRTCERHPKIMGSNGQRQLGTLGTGNHFIEVCLDTEDNVWVMLHSGSRGVGNKIGTYFTEMAKEACERWHIDLPDPNLAYLPQGEALFDDYIAAMTWANDYAKKNRELMMQATLDAIQTFIPSPLVGEETAINCHHNYATMENHFGQNVWVTRKGAVRARAGDLGIIPGSMGARSFIVRGKGNSESFDSCSHGAGRRMSRTEARKRFTVEHLKAQTHGVECRKDADVIDEIPDAYKDIDEVMGHQTDLVDVVAELRQVICVKG